MGKCVRKIENETENETDRRMDGYICMDVRYIPISLM